MLHRYSFARLVLYWLISCFLAGTAMAQPICEQSGETRIWISPLNPQSTGTIKIMAVSAAAPAAQLSLFDDQDQAISLSIRRRGGPPWSLLAEVENLPPGNYRVLVQSSGSEPAACREVIVDTPAIAQRLQTWDLASEAFYSAWIEELFGAPAEENFSFASLEPVLRNAGRNFLHNYLGQNEDANLPLTPDCADLPYTLRAYFAWKTGLPFAYRACNRGSANAPPKCGPPSIVTEFMHGASSQASFRKFTRQLTDTVHSGSARTGIDDESADFYPIPLRRETLWPGTIFADPYGHILVLAEWVPQTADRPGMLLAIDAQPDNSVARKKVWEGTALFANAANAGPGFKAFRPLIRTTPGKWRVLSNRELTGQSGFVPFSREQEQLAPDDFYARLTKLINPDGLNPLQAYETMFAALVEQIETRVNSVDNGEAYMRNNPRRAIPMPSGAAIFQTVGPWEDYATPSRDMRLLIAINVLNDLPDKIVRHPELFVLGDKNPETIRSEIKQRHTQRTWEHSIRYTRSDGSEWELPVAEILQRKPQFEMAYNPNDCIEIRWGAQPGMEEFTPCHRFAPAEQRAKMEQYRIWFREARRPSQ